MRGDAFAATGMWSDVRAEERIPTDHPIRRDFSRSTPFTVGRRSRRNAYSARC